MAALATGGCESLAGLDDYEVGPLDAATDSGAAAADAGEGPECDAPRRLCDGTCVEPTDPRFCGSCDNDCTALDHVAGARVGCNADGQCVISGDACERGFAQCNDEVQDGCETPISTGSNCGGCDEACPDDRPLCADMGADGAAPDYRCVVDCGDPALTACGTECVDTDSSVAHCGGCDDACPAVDDAQPSCDAGECDFSCNGGYHRCDNGCVDDASVDSCGSRCEPCEAPANATATCDGSECGFACNSDFKRCDDVCIPQADCCTDDDCNAGSACVAGECRSFCQQQSRPADVEAADYQCLDFDRSADLPWTVDTPSNVAATTTSRAYSLPRSFESGVSSTEQGSMSWQAPGGYDVDSVTVSTRMYPMYLPSPIPPGVTIRLLEIDIPAPGTNQALYYGNGVSLGTTSGTIDDYTGFYTTVLIRVGPALVYDCPLSGDLNWGEWNTIEYTAGPPNTVRFNGTDVGDCGAAVYGTDPTISLGYADANISGRAYFDDVVVSVRRSPP